LNCLQEGEQIFALAPPTNPIWRRKHGSLYGVPLELWCSYGMLRQNVTNHQILMRISTVSTNRHSRRQIIIDLEFFCDKYFKMMAAKPEVVSNLEMNSKAEKFRRISPILLHTYVARIIAERL
jgi:hypothetical protein